jgi:hypothetical protein
MVLLNLETGDHPQLTWQDDFKNGPFSGIFIVRNRPERISMIQTILVDDNVQEIQFYAFDDSSLEGIDLKM